MHGSAFSVHGRECARIYIASTLRRCSAGARNATLRDLARGWPEAARFARVYRVAVAAASINTMAPGIITAVTARSRGDRRDWGPLESHIGDWGTREGPRTLERRCRSAGDAVVRRHWGWHVPLVRRVVSMVSQRNAAVCPRCPKPLTSRYSESRGLLRDPFRSSGPLFASNCGESSAAMPTLRRRRPPSPAPGSRCSLRRWIRRTARGGARSARHLAASERPDRGWR